MATRQITGLTAQKRNPQRVNVFLDGEFTFGISRILAAWIRIGQEISDERVAQLRADDEREVAFQQALKYLSYRSRTCSEIKGNLAKHEIPEGAIEEVLSRLSQLGLVDDARFASEWVENRSEFRPRSRRALAVELRQRGLESETIDETLAGLDEEALASQAARKYAHRLAGLDQLAFRQKMIAHLGRRGFNYHTSAEATALVWAEQHDEFEFGEVEKQ